MPDTALDRARPRRRTWMLALLILALATLTACGGIPLVPLI